MPSFNVKFRTAAGKRGRRREQGESELAVRKRMGDAGLFLTYCKRVKEKDTVGNKVYRLKISEKDLCEILLQLEIQLASGTYLEEALDAIKDDFPTARGRFLLREIHLMIANSRGGFSQALAQFPRIFPRNILTVIESGAVRGTKELAGRLKDVRERIMYVSKIRKQIIWALIYPVSVGLVGSALLIFLQAGLFPRLITMLADMGVTKLPPVTVVAMALSHFFVHWWKLMVFVLVAGPVSLGILRRFDSTAMLIDEAIINLPLFGDVYKMLITALIFRVYRSLYADGRDPIEILDLCKELSPNRAVSAGINRVQLSILSGEPLDVAFKRAGYFPKMACATIHAGLEGGSLKEAMEYISEVYTDLAKERISIAIGVFTWTLFAVIAVMVALTVVGFFSAVYSVVQSIH